MQGKRLLYKALFIILLGVFFFRAGLVQAAVSYEGYLYVELDGQNNGGSYKELNDVVVDVWSTGGWDSCTMVDDGSDGCGGDGSCTQGGWDVPSHYACSDGSYNPCSISCSPKPSECTSEERHGTPVRCDYYKQVQGGNFPKFIAWDDSDSSGEFHTKNLEGLSCQNTDGVFISPATDMTGSSQLPADLQSCTGGYWVAKPDGFVSGSLNSGSCPESEHYYRTPFTDVTHLYSFGSNDADADCLDFVWIPTGCPPNLSCSSLNITDNDRSLTLDTSKEIPVYTGAEVGDTLTVAHSASQKGGTGWSRVGDVSEVDTWDWSSRSGFGLVENYKGWAAKSSGTGQVTVSEPGIYLFLTNAYSSDCQFSCSTGGIYYESNNCAPSPSDCCYATCSDPYGSDTTHIHACYEYPEDVLSGYSTSEYCNNSLDDCGKYLIVEETSDDTPPTSEVTSPSGCQNSDFSVSVDDSDAGGSGLKSCYYKVFSAGVGWTKEETERECNSSFTVTVGPTGDCRAQGASSCAVYVYAEDNAGNVGGESGRNFAIDWTKPTSTITSPNEGSLQDSNFSVSVDDSDGETGLGTCYYHVYDSTAGWTKAWATRSCNSSFTVTVGSTGDCRTEGSGTCYVYAFARDNCGNTGDSSIRSFDIGEECTSEDYKGCYNNDIYWFDSCGNPEYRVEDCGNDGYENTEDTRWKDYRECCEIEQYEQVYYERGCSEASGAPACFKDPTTTTRWLNTGNTSYDDTDCPCPSDGCIDADGDGLEDDWADYPSGNCNSSCYCDSCDATIEDDSPACVVGPVIKETSTTQTRHCEDSNPSVSLHWELKEGGGEQEWRQVRIYEGATLVEDTGKEKNSNNTYSPSGLSWNTTYDWEVQVWDAEDNASGWAEDSVTTDSGSISPGFIPPPPDEVPLEKEVKFYDESTTVGTLTISSWSWQFDGAEPSSSALQDPTVIFTEVFPEGNNVTLEVSGDGLTCTAQETLYPKLNLPEWEEVAPE